MKLWILSVLILCVGIALADSPEKFSQVKIYVPDRAGLDQIWSTGIDYEGVIGKVGGWMEFVAGSHELQELAAKEIPFEVVIDNLGEYYENRMTQGPVNALGFGYGSMGGYYTFNEVVRQLDTMQLLYPNLITIRDSIGNTHEGRAIWAVKISDNPNVNEQTEPEVLYTALHHAREPEGMMSVIYYMWWLLENYGANSEATYLVDNRQMWFIPIVNPDGYVYNQTTNPNGGGFWRKNRRNNGGSFGVDPNRNYGPLYMWDSQIVPGGSSTSPSSDTYRGPAPFSEPENHAIDNFMRLHNVKLCLNYHTYGNYLIYPFGYLARENADSLIYRDWAYDLTADNRFTNGTDEQTVAYSTRGTSDDYMYGDTTKPITYAMTPEVGTTGFWPTLSEIFPLAIGNRTMNTRLAYLAGHYTVLSRNQISTVDETGFLRRNSNFTFTATLKNKGLNAAANLSVEASSSLPSVQFLAPVTVVNLLAPQAETDVVFNGYVSPSAPMGVPLQLYLRLVDADGFAHIDTINLFTGAPTIVFADSASSGTGNWTTGSGWNSTANAHTPPAAFTDSPTGNYSPNANNSLTLNSQLNLAGYDHAQLRFWTKWAAEPTWDFATVEISTNNGTNWTTLRTPLSHKGSTRSGSQQPSGSWGYDSYTPGQAYVEQAVDLSVYVNRQIRLRFRMAADASEQRDGFYVDDIRVYGYTINLDTAGIITTPPSLTLQGRPGTRLDQTVTVRNFTANPLTFAVTETTLTALAGPQQPFEERGLDFTPYFNRLKSMSLPAPLPPQTDNPLVFTTSILDSRGDNFVYGVDVLEVLSQKRTTILGPVLDLRVRMINPDSDVAGFLSIDADQDFGSGVWPTPWNLGPRTRDLGSEFEILVDVSGRISDSLGFGYNPIAVIFRTADTSVAYIPIIPAISFDSVLTVTISGIPLGGLGLNDPDQSLNIGTVFARLSTAPFPDYGPDYGHGLVGAENGVSWIRESETTINVAAGDSATFDVSVLAAKPAGLYDAALTLTASGVAPIVVPVHMTVTSPGNSHIALSATSLTDTLVQNDSSAFVLTISNTGDADLIWGMIDSAGTPWLLVLPSFGVVVPSTSNQTTFIIRSGGLTPDSTYRATLRLISNDATSGSIAFPVTLRVDQTTAVESKGRPLPTTFALHQNYPNPFNPETNISFDLPRSSFVTLKIFNIIGQEVASVVSGQLDAGRYRYVVGSERFSSGVYFYRLQAEGFIQTRKMIITK